MANDYLTNLIGVFATRNAVNNGVDKVSEMKMELLRLEVEDKIKTWTPDITYEITNNNLRIKSANRSRDLLTTIPDNFTNMTEEEKLFLCQRLFWQSFQEINGIASAVYQDEI